MRYFVLLVFVLNLVSCGPVTGKMVSSNVSDIPIKTLAILPFNVSPDTNRLLNGISSESLIRSIKLSRYRFQRYLYIGKKNPAKHKVIFQDFMHTNELLKQKAIPEILRPDMADKLCRLLRVDAIVFGNIKLLKPMSQEQSDLINGVVGFGVAPSNKIIFDLFTYDASGNLRYQKKYIGRGNVEDEKIVNKMMKKISNTFPF